MVKQEKIDMVSAIKEKLDNVNSFYIADYFGLTVEEFAELRKRLRAKNGEIVVTKNRMAKHALTEIGKDNINSYLTGPNAIVYVYDDPISVLKEVVTFFKEVNKGAVKVGHVENNLVMGKDIQTLASLPGIKELQAKLVGTIGNPIYKFVHSLNWFLISFVNVLEQIKKEKEEA